MGVEQPAAATGDVERPAIEFAGTSKRYRREDGATLEALADVSFAVDDGEFVTVVGPSGCGKTTLIRLAAGLEAPAEGTVRVGGQRVERPGADRGVVFQGSRLFPWLTVRENVAFGLDERGRPDDGRVNRLLELVGLVDHADAYPKALSGGMKQRVGIARALALDPDVLLMDEPFASVDARTRRGLQDELVSLWDDTAKTVLFVTHDVEEAVYLGDRAVVMTDRPGRVREIVDVDVPRPRNRTDERVSTLRARVLNLIGSQDGRA